jgi:hypothetical protein
MKYISIITSLSLGLTALVTSGCVAGVADTTTGGSGYDDSAHYDDGTDFRAKVRHLRDHYARVRDEADYRGASRHIRGELVEISEGIDRVASFVYSGQFIPERAQENISRLHHELRAVSDEMRQ